MPSNITFNQKIIKRRVSGSEMKWKQDQNYAFTFEKCVFDVEASERVRARRQKAVDTVFEPKEPPTVTMSGKKSATGEQ